MRFPTEDHLMIHRHKHEMTLKFPSIKTDNMLSDQTPTPTRFLKNCEEVGLFTELDCSLEHEFRKAQEEESSKRNISMHNTVGGAMTGPGTHQLGSSRMASHDTSVVIQQAMPSPQSSSVITQAPSTNRQIGPVPGSLSSLLHLHNRQRQPMPASMPGTLPNPTMPGSSAVLMPMERQMSVNSGILGMQGPNLSEPCASPQVQPMHSEAKMRVKAALTHHPAAMANGNMNTMGHVMEMMGSRQDQAPHHHMHSHPHQHQTLPPHHPYPHQHQHPAHHPHPQPHHQQNHPHHHSHSHLHAHPAHHQTSPHPPLHTGNQAQVSPATQQMQPTQTIQPQPTGGRRRRVVDEDPDERRRKFLERNRAAATRCRQTCSFRCRPLALSFGTPKALGIAGAASPQALVDPSCHATCLAPEALQVCSWPGINSGPLHKMTYSVSRPSAWRRVGLPANSKRAGSTDLHHTDF
uniref:cAMP responsive element binding protein 5 n=1 Tax=Oryctolagus cuniculus TaxID=9986 RepID=A0A5F9CAE7_RABIT